nr:hypothetical protein Itr_chr02CG25460 [Ipomoea trifida]
MIRPVRWSRLSVAEEEELEGGGRCGVRVRVRGGLVVVASSDFNILRVICQNDVVLANNPYKKKKNWC